MSNRLSHLPSVNQVILEIDNSIPLHERYLKIIINKHIGFFRQRIKTGEFDFNRDVLLEKIVKRVSLESLPSLVNIINGTGIVLHTGFGRAPFEGKRLRSLARRLDGYVNLEFNLSDGKRGDRLNHIDQHMAAICGSESSMMVNNNAAAVLLSLNTLSRGGEVICSRGQMVAIGGSFRIPDIIEKSNSVLIDVGTTNRTNISDYKKAITKKTKLLLWVHTSNYVVQGFTKNISLDDLVSLGRAKRIPVMVDLGSGALLSLIEHGLPEELPVRNIVEQGVDITTFSGDKLLGGPQCGIIIGSKILIEKMKKNTLYRTMRCDKIKIGLMDETLHTYGETGFSKMNLTLNMLVTSRKVLKKRANRVISALPKSKIKKLGISVVDSSVEAGSGSLPVKSIESAALSFKPVYMKVSNLASAFRDGAIPLVGYTFKNRFYIDLKAVLPHQVDRLTDAIDQV